MTQNEVERRFNKLAAAINAKAKKLGAPGRITAYDLAVLFTRANRRCAYCGIEVSARGVSFDHKQAFAKGGPNTVDNLAVSCMTCQRGKFTKTPDEWAQAKDMEVACEGCGVMFKPRWADYQRGYGRMHSRSCSGKKGGQQGARPAA